MVSCGLCFVRSNASIGFCFARSQTSCGFCFARSQTSCGFCFAHFHASFGLCFAHSHDSFGLCFARLAALRKFFLSIARCEGVASTMHTFKFGRVGLRKGILGDWSL